MLQPTLHRLLRLARRLRARLSTAWASRGRAAPPAPAMTSARAVVVGTSPPVQTPQRRQLQPDPAPRVNAPHAGPRGDLVLVAEDNATNQLVVRAQLQSLGLDCAIAIDGNEAIELATRRPWLLILMDCQMPGLDGISAARTIRELEAGKRRTPIIAVTAHASPEVRRACLAAGMDDCLSKPFSRADLADAIAAQVAPQAPKPIPA